MDGNGGTTSNIKMHNEWMYYMQFEQIVLFDMRINSSSILNNDGKI